MLSVFLSDLWLLLSHNRCLVEIYTALTEGVPIVAVCVAGAFPYNFADAQHYLENLETELELRNPGSSDVIRQAGVSIPVMAKLLRESLPNIISKRWEPGGSEAVLAAQLEDIIAAMENARQQVDTSQRPTLPASTFGRTSQQEGLGSNLLGLQ